MPAFPLPPHSHREVSEHRPPLPRPGFGLSGELVRIDLSLSSHGLTMSQSPANVQLNSFDSVIGCICIFILSSSIGPTHRDGNKKALTRNGKCLKGSLSKWKASSAFAGPSSCWQLPSPRRHRRKQSATAAGDSRHGAILLKQGMASSCTVSMTLLTKEETILSPSLGRD